MNRLKKLKLQIQQLFPQRLPLTEQEYDRMISEVLIANDLPDEADYKYAIASAIMHLGPTTSTKPKKFFARSAHKAMANQLAFKKMKQLEKEEQEKIQTSPRTETVNATDVSTTQENLVS